MSFKKIKRFFSFKRTRNPQSLSTPKEGSPEDTILKLKEMEHVLIKKEKFLEENILKEMKIARSNAINNKRAAMQALKRKRRHEKQLKQVDGTLTSLEMQREILETAAPNAEVLSVMKTAATALKEAQKHVYKINKYCKNYPIQKDIDKIHDVMDEVNEQQDLVKVISEAIANPIGSNDIDEDDIERELQEIEQQEIAEGLLNLKFGQLSPLPDVTRPREDTKCAADIQNSATDDEQISSSSPGISGASSSSRNKKSATEDKDLKELEEWLN